MSAQHSPGPWMVDDALAESLTVMGDYGEGWRICEVTYYGVLAGDKYPDAEANARLIAASPDLLAVARELAALAPELWPTPDYDPSTSDRWGRLRKMTEHAIAKATEAQP